MSLFYEPTKEQITKLSGPWCCSYSGGKDSTSLVTWIEWLRRTGTIDAPKPQLVQCDTMVEYPVLADISQALMVELSKTGWQCAVVRPLLKEKLYNRILGIGNTPIHPGIRSMRWCTRSTKIDPMDRWRAEHSSGLTITGLRLGESTIRDGKIKAKGCSAGGECGIPNPTDRTYSPLLRWSTCHVIDWLTGQVSKEIRRDLGDLLPSMKRLVEIYDVRVDRDVFEWADPEVTAARFGCIGCPAIQVEAHAPDSSTRRHGADSPLNELYQVWFDARLAKNRLANNQGAQCGPIRMEVRKQLFARIMDIQRRAGVLLVTPEDETFIRQCWIDKVYPRGWSEADEHVEAAGLFVGASA